MTTGEGDGVLERPERRVGVTQRANMRSALDALVGADDPPDNGDGLIIFTATADAIFSEGTPDVDSLARLFNRLAAGRTKAWP